jgi:hypothetical protein
MWNHGHTKVEARLSVEENYSLIGRKISYFLESIHMKVEEEENYSFIRRKRSYYLGST